MAKKKTAKKTTKAKKIKKVAKKKKASKAKKPAVKVKRKAVMKKVEIKGVKKPGETKTTYDVRIQTKKLGEAPQEYHFVLKSGQKLKSLQELASALEGMGEDVFEHHVNDFKNDFAKWVEDVFDEKQLAEQMKAVENKMESELKLLRHIVKKIRG